MAVFVFWFLCLLLFLLTRLEGVSTIKSWYPTCVYLCSQYCKEYAIEGLTCCSKQCTPPRVATPLPGIHLKHCRSLACCSITDPCCSLAHPSQHKSNTSKCFDSFQSIIRDAQFLNNFPNSRIVLDEGLEQTAWNIAKSWWVELDIGNYCLIHH